MAAQVRSISQQRQAPGSGAAAAAGHSTALAPATAPPIINADAPPTLPSADGSSLLIDFDMSTTITPAADADEETAGTPAGAAGQGAGQAQAARLAAMRMLAALQRDADAGRLGSADSMRVAAPSAVAWSPDRPPPGAGSGEQEFSFVFIPPGDDSAALAADAIAISASATSSAKAAPAQAAETRFAAQVALLRRQLADGAAGGAVGAASLPAAIEAAAVPGPKHPLPAGDTAARTDTASMVGTLVFRSDCLCVCLIDDCDGRDLPIGELKVAEVDVTARLTRSGTTTKATVKAGGCTSCEYYNGVLSSWEPLVEPWPCKMQVRLDEAANTRHAVVSVFADVPLELNVSPGVLQAVAAVTEWRSALASQSGRLERTRFVAYKLDNCTGLPLDCFCVVNGAVTGNQFSVAAGEDLCFDFVDGREKLRHLGTHVHTVHKLALRLAGWEPLEVSVDRVAVSAHSLVALPGPPGRTSTRLVVDVSVVDSRKVVRVRSALVLCNNLAIPLDVRLEGRAGDATVLPVMPPHSETAVPLHKTSAVVKLRPHGWGYQWSTTGVSWENFGRASGHRRMGLGLACRSIGEGADGEAAGPVNRFRCCVSVQKERMPVTSFPSPGHTLTVAPPLILTNLLPVRVSFTVMGLQAQGDIASGANTALYDANLQENVQLTVELPGFRRSRPALISCADQSRSRPDRFVSVTDAKGRSLCLTLEYHRDRGAGGATQVSLSVPYWMVNRTGLPLVYRQISRSQPAAGLRGDDVSVLCSSAPFMFACDPDHYGGGECNVGVHRRSRWSSDLTLDSVGRAGTLLLSGEDGRDIHWLGMEIERGVGLFTGTKIITFVPRYLLVNATSHDLLYAPRYQQQQQQQQQRRGDHGRLPAGASLPFHWQEVTGMPRLAVQIDNGGSGGGTTWTWSCDFPVDKVGTSHVRLLQKDSDAVFLLRCDVRICGATVLIQLADAGENPPFRLENRSLVELTYHQQGSDTLSVIAPGETAGYAWQDLNRALLLVVCVKDTAYNCAQRYDLQRIYTGPVLGYPQFFLIELGGGLVLGPLRDGADAHDVGVVPHAPRDPGQMWRLEADGRLHNKAGFQMVVAGSDSGDGAALAVRLARATKTPPRPGEKWKFGGGRLLSFLQNRQTVPGGPFVPLALRIAGPVAAGARLEVSPLHDEAGGPLLRQATVPPGSGRLVAQVFADGPTRVLRITDAADAVATLAGGEGDGWVSVERRGRFRHNVVGLSTRDAEGDKLPGGGAAATRAMTSATTTTVELELRLPAGVGVSVVDGRAEELVYASSRGIEVLAAMTPDALSLDVAVMHTQLDNQAQQQPVMPVMLHPVPLPAGQPLHPALRVNVVRARRRVGGVVVYRTFSLALRPLALRVEERVLLRLLAMGGVGRAAGGGGVGGQQAGGQQAAAQQAAAQQAAADLEATTRHALEADLTLSAAGGGQEQKTYFEVGRRNPS